MDEIKKAAPYLSGIEKKNAYSVPDGYFESVLPRLQDTLAKKSADQVNAQPLRPVLAYVLFSVLALLISAGVLYLTREKKMQSAEVKDYEFEYAASEIDEMTVFTAYYEFITDTVTRMNASEIKRSEVIDYLVYEGIEEDVILDDEQI